LIGWTLNYKAHHYITTEKSSIPNGLILFTFFNVIIIASSKENNKLLAI
jgi:hypothetical protein